jgi:hypothetical protein
MPTQEIKETNWELFCRRFDEALRGIPITLSVVRHDGATAELARQAPLREFVFNKTAGCSDTIEIKLGETPNTTVQHSIVEPIHVRLREDPDAKKALVIDAEAGSVELQFSSGKIGALLKDLDLG